MMHRGGSMISMISDDEYLDLVDEHDNVIGNKKRSEIYAEKLSNYRVINAFVMNSKGELWIPRRTANKKLYPLSLDISVGGHVATGENYEDALRREAYEELNINVDKFPKRLLGYLNPQNDNVSSFMKVYEIKMDTIPQYNKDDFVEYFYFTPHELYERLCFGESAKSDLLKLLMFFYL
jgi:isopentenyldiphosphate isomerase